MIDKIKTILTITIIVIIVILLGWGIFKFIFSLFDKPELITKDNINEYLANAEIVTNYSTYYFYSNSLDNLVEACNKGLHEELYNIYLKEYREKYSKETIISQLKEKISDEIVIIMDYEFEYKLEKLYKVGDKYLAEVNIEGNNIYILFEEATTKEYSYNFALIN